MKGYDPKKIEKKWQKEWARKKAFKANDTSKKKKYYSLIEFPYPSGDGLHVGHIRSNTAMDVVSRKRRAQGFEVLYPIGYDAFGLPAENYALKTGIHPSVTTKKNIATFRRQLTTLGFSFDWSREISTADPEYYRWTQWIFLRMFEAGLAYKKRMAINWCPKDKIGLANEEVVNGNCERCGTPVEQREKEQWMLAITKYADRLDKDLDTVDFLPRIKTQQRNWIGRSEGSRIDFAVKGSDASITVFTTRADTLYGVTYLVIAPEHPQAEKLAELSFDRDQVIQYIGTAKRKDLVLRAATDREKTGVPLEGVFAVHPITGRDIPVFVADYVLADYGTGAVMAVPGHDERDFAFAKKYRLPIIEVISGGDVSKAAYVGEGVLVNSNEFDGRNNSEVMRDITLKAGGTMTTTYKLRDWVFSRQRYWGEPIPLVYCEACAKTDEKHHGWVPVPESELPLKLPKVAHYQPTDTGESPLSSIPKWVNTKCPRCKGPARRETDTMPNWAGSSWYFLRYTDPKNKKAFAGKPKLSRWMPVDWYNGGMEHVTLHLLYSRFWHKFLYDEGLVGTLEPYQKRTAHGLILAEGGVKMSKSKGNVINPDDIVKRFGADALRLYEMFMGPFDQAITWQEDGVVGTYRFLERIFRIAERVVTSKESVTASPLHTALQRTVAKISDDIEQMKFNTAISALMVFVNECEKAERIPSSLFSVFLQLLAPFAPHAAEELWSRLKNKGFIHTAGWPTYDTHAAVLMTSEVAVQINGKTRGIISLLPTATQDEALETARKSADISKWLTSGEIRKIIYVPGKILSLVV